MRKEKNLSPGMVLETALYVEDLERSLVFYRDVLGLEAASEPVERMAALRINKDQVLLLFKKAASKKARFTPHGTIPPHDGSGNLHVAFSIEASDFKAWIHLLESKDIEIESTVQWPGGGSSIYFRDPDKHALELKTSNWYGEEPGI